MANYTEIYPLTPEQHLEWVLLDMFDWLSPEYDQPQTAATLQRWLHEAGLTGIKVKKSYHLVGRGTKQSR